jgi:hypothetical protein
VDDPESILHDDLTNVKWRVADAGANIEQNGHRLLRMQEQADSGCMGIQA